MILLSEIGHSALGHSPYLRRSPIQYFLRTRNRLQKSKHVTDSNAVCRRSTKVSSALNGLYHDNVLIPACIRFFLFRGAYFVMGKMAYGKLNHSIQHDVSLTTGNVLVQDLVHIHLLHILSHFSFHIKIYHLSYLGNCIIVYEPFTVS
jgi:hypothetical protein